MASPVDRPLTRGRVALDTKKAEEEKRKQAFLERMAEEVTEVGPRDIVNLNTSTLKVEVDVKTEPEAEAGPTMIDIPQESHAVVKEEEDYGRSVNADSGIIDTQDQHIIKEEVDLPIDSISAVTSPTDELIGTTTPSQECGCSCSDEIKLLKEENREIREMRDKFQEELNARGVMIQVASQECQTDDEIKAKDLKIQELTERVDLLEAELEKIRGLHNQLRKHDEFAAGSGNENENRLETTADPVLESNNQPVTDVLAEVCVNNQSDEEPMDERVTNLFPKVLQVFWKKYAVLQENKRDYLNLNCRLACKAWKKGMDELLTGDTSPIGFRTDISLTSGASTGSKELTDLLNRWIEHGRDKIFPFPPQQLRISDWDLNAICSNAEEDVITCRLATKACLERFGNDIQMFEYAMNFETVYKSWGGDSRENSYDTLRDWLMMMPNLKHLIFHNLGTEYCNDSQLLETSFANAVNCNPFPELKLLTTFRVIGGNFSEDFLLSVLQANPQLQGFSWIGGNVRQRVAHQITLAPKLASLDLRLRLYGGDEEDNHLDSSLRSLAGPLEALRIQLEYLNSNYVPDNGNKLPMIFDAVASIKSLKYLDINIPPILSSYHPSPMTLPNLLKLTVRMGCVSHPLTLSTDQELLRVISQLKTLQRLTIYNFPVERLGWTEKLEKVTTSQLRKLLENHFVEKLWTLFPSLKMVEMVYHSYFVGIEGDERILFIREK